MVQTVLITEVSDDWVGGNNASGDGDGGASGVDGHGGGDGDGDGDDCSDNKKYHMSNMGNVCVFKLKTKFTKPFFVLKMSIKVFWKWF